MAPSVPPPPASSAAPAGTGSATTPPPAGRDAWIAGRTITLRGRVSREPWQHMMGHVPGKQPEYFDLEGGSQTVVYTSNPISCAGLVELEGTVVELRGGSKRGGKADETFVEKHLDVTGARCLP
jgi:hypothetical protein